MAKFTFTLAILVTYLFSCNSTINETEKHSEKKAGVVYSYDVNGEKKGQFLINDAGDTVHSVIYKNGEIISNEGVFLIADMEITDQEKQIVEFTIHSIDIDTLDRLVLIREFVNDSLGYNRVLAVEKVDTSCFKFNLEFSKNPSDIIVAIQYGVNSTLEMGYLRPVIISFGKESSITPKVVLHPAIQ